MSALTTWIEELDNQRAIQRRQEEEQLQQMELQQKADLNSQLGGIASMTPDVNDRDLRALGSLKEIGSAFDAAKKKAATQAQINNENDLADLKSSALQGMMEAEQQHSTNRERLNRLAIGGISDLLKDVPRNHPNRFEIQQRGPDDYVQVEKALKPEQEKAIRSEELGSYLGLPPEVVHEQLKQETAAATALTMKGQKAVQQQGKAMTSMIDESLKPGHEWMDDVIRLQGDQGNIAAKMASGYLDQARAGMAKYKDETELKKVEAGITKDLESWFKKEIANGTQPTDALKHIPEQASTITKMIFASRRQAKAEVKALLNPEKKALNLEKFKALPLARMSPAEHEAVTQSLMADYGLGPNQAAALVGSVKASQEQMQQTRGKEYFGGIGGILGEAAGMTAEPFKLLGRGIGAARRGTSSLLDVLGL